MTNRRAAWVAAAALALSALPLCAQTPPDGIETLLVTGEQPGPGLWKVSRGDHVLWILGGSGALPRDFVWRSAQIEALVADADEVLYVGTTQVQPDIGMFRALTLLPSLLKAGRNPNGATLADVLPPATHAKWRAMHEKYVGSGDALERWRPTIALGQLQSKAFEKSGLTFKTSARAVVDRAARKHDVRITRPPVVERRIHVDAPRALLKRAATREVSDVACFERELDRLEQRLADAKLLANAWATGDVDAQRDWHAREKREAAANTPCELLLLEALVDDPAAKSVVDDLKQQADIAGRANDWNWLRAARRALATNRSTFAVLPMAQLFDPDGYVAQLRAEGYEVAEP